MGRRSRRRRQKRKEMKALKKEMFGKDWKDLYKKEKKVIQTPVVVETKSSGGTKSKVWESELQISSDHKCPHVGDPKTEIIIPYEIWNRIISLTKELDTEWLGYLGASFRTDGYWQVTDLRVPKQEVTGSSVKPTETEHSEGVVHSHVGMGTFFSGTDDDFLNENHNFSIVVNNRGEHKAVIRHKLPCGAMTLIDAKVELYVPGVADVSSFIESAKKNITEKTYSYPTVYDQNRKKWGNKHKNRPWDVDDDDNTDGQGVPDYVPKKNNRKEYEFWDYGDDYAYWSNWAEFAD